MHDHDSKARGDVDNVVDYCAKQSTSCRREFIISILEFRIWCSNKCAKAARGDARWWAWKCV